MTNTKHFIAGDWGTSNLRLYLCAVRADNSSQIADTRFGPGVSEVNGDFEDKFFNLAQDWLDQHAAMPVILSGMVGSTIGWKEAPYLTCPVTAQKVAEGRISFSARGIEFSILAGLKTTNPLGVPDVMRGEELQLLGWMLANNATRESRLFALPGTHNKWTQVVDGQIHNFLTAFTGELFAILRRDSILITDDRAISFNADVFMQAVRAVENLGDAHLVHALFATRSKQVLGEMASVDALSYLSGLITAADVIGATRLFDSYSNNYSNIDGSGTKDSVTVIAEATLREHYLMVFEHLGIPAQACDPADIAIAGFTAIYQNLYS